MKIAKTVLLAILVFGFASCVIANIYIHLNYASKMPVSPQPDTGRIYRIEVNHGFVRYVSRDELDRADFVRHKLFVVGLVFLMGITALVVYWNELGVRS